MTRWKTSVSNNVGKKLTKKIAEKGNNYDRSTETLQVRAK